MSRCTCNAANGYECPRCLAAIQAMQADPGYIDALDGDRADAEADRIYNERGVV